MSDTLHAGQTTTLPPKTQDAGVLNEPETPLGTLRQFFECFHLKEAREEIRELCQMAVTTDNSTCITGQRRSNVLYFGEKLEALIGACFILLQHPEQIPAQQDATPAEPEAPDKLNQQNPYPDPVMPEQQDHYPHPETYDEEEEEEEEDDDVDEEDDNDDDDDYHYVDPEDEDMPYYREPMLIEYLPNEPEYVLEMVFSNTYLYDFRETFMPRWLMAALVNGNSDYGEPEERRALVRFYDALLPLIEALHCINEQNKRSGKNTQPILPPEVRAENEPKLLPGSEILAPLRRVKKFCREFPVVYVRRELRCFLIAGATYEDPDTDYADTSLILEMYEQVLALIETAYVLCNEEGSNQIR